MVPSGTLPGQEEEVSRIKYLKSMTQSYQLLMKCPACQQNRLSGSPVLEVVLHNHKMILVNTLLQL
jgi:hypothetical protein